MKTKKILWIDDMLEWSSTVQFNLSLVAENKDISLKCLPQKNGEDLKQILMQYDFDLIVMDYHMEPFSGDKYIKDIRFEEHLEHIPILFYSQDTSTDLKSLISDIKNVEVVYRPNLEDKIREKLNF